jgi:hypothetical protein
MALPAGTLLGARTGGLVLRVLMNADLDEAMGVLVTADAPAG